MLDQYADDRIGEAPFGSNGVKSLGNARQRVRFGAHPMTPFLSVGREIVMLADRAQGLELIGHHATLDTNFSNALVGDVESGFAFAAGIGFPAQGVIVIGSHEGLPAPDVALIKDIATPAQLRAALTKVFGACGFAFVETDMRAHRNPHRMRAIKRASIDLITCARSAGPVCDRPGFVAAQKLAGLPWVLCATPTSLPRADLIRCAGCAHQIERPVAVTHVDAAQCDVCNPEYSPGSLAPPVPKHVPSRSNGSLNHSLSRNRLDASFAGFRS